MNLGKGATMKTFTIEWANGRETITGKNLRHAVSNIKSPIHKIVTGFLVRVSEGKTLGANVSYWDCREFWKVLGERKKGETMSDLRRGYHHIIRWIDDGMRESANNAFSEGDLRLAAQLVEYAKKGYQKNEATR